MGSLVYGECKCGYKKERMCLGGGMDSFETVANFPYYCKTCEAVMMHNTFMKPAICSCGQLMVRYDDPTLSKPKSEVPSEVFNWNFGDNEKLVLTENGYLCPKCKEYTLEWCPGGCWD